MSACRKPFRFVQITLGLRAYPISKNIFFPLYDYYISTPYSALITPVSIVYTATHF